MPNDNNNNDDNNNISDDDDDMTKLDLPANDSRTYHTMTLSSNGLKCLLISDAEADKAAAAVAVGVGQMQDPPHFAGLAHLTEHALFMGTEKWPDENEYDRYLSANGGHSNAYTDLEVTCYYMDCHNASLSGALDRMASCFVAPLLKADSLEREIQAVDSEHAKNMQSDHWRIHQLARTILGNGNSNDNSNSNNNDNNNTVVHPYASFGSGNRESLLAEAQGHDIPTLRKAVKEFYQTHYKACHMALVVYGSQSIAELQALVQEHFGAVPSSSSCGNNNDNDKDNDNDTNMTMMKKLQEDKAEAQAQHIHILPSTPPLTPTNLPIRLDVVPIRDHITVELQWPMRQIQTLYKSKPTRYLSHLLGHEGPGSLLYVLREKQYAQELGADDVSKSCRSFSIFTLQLELTQLGLEHLDEIMQMIYYYITHLLGQGGIPDWVFEELQATSDMQFRFLSKHPPSDTVSSLAPHMHLYPTHHVVSGPYKLYGSGDKSFDDPESHVKECWKQLTPSNMLMIVSAKEFEGVTDKIDPWYGTQYRQVPIDEQQIQKWMNHPKEPLLIIIKDLHLPARNDMIATAFDLIQSHPAFVQESRHDGDDTGDSSSSSISLLLPPPPSPPPPPPPRCLMDTPTCRLWYKPDTVFEMPKVNIMVLARTAVTYAASPWHSVLASLWVEVVHEQCNEFSYAASMAGLHCFFSCTRGGMEITVSGYNQKAGILLQHIVDTIQAVPNNTSQGLFDRIVDKLEKQFSAFFVAQPYQHAIYSADLCLEDTKWKMSDRLACLQNDISLKDFQHFSAQLLSRFQLEMLVHGNVSPTEAMRLLEILTAGWKPQPPLHLPALRVVRLEKAAAAADDDDDNGIIYPQRGWNEENNNSCVLNVFQLGPVDLRTNAVLSLLHHLIREPAFNQLRTEEQLGYIVHTGIKTNGEKVKSLIFLIQSDSFDPIHMDARIEAFLVDFRSKLVQMSQQDFDINVVSVCQNLLEKNKNLSEESNKHWSVITNQTYRFHRLQEIAAYAKDLTKADVLRLFDKYLLSKSPYRRKLSIRMFGKNHVEQLKKQVTKENGSDHNSTAVVIDDPIKFRETQSLFPVQRAESIDELMLAIVDEEGGP